MSLVLVVEEYRRTIAVNLFGHRIPAPILFAPIGINKLYGAEGELVPAKVAGELGLPVSHLCPS